MYIKRLLILFPLIAMACSNQEHTPVSSVAIDLYLSIAKLETRSSILNWNNTPITIVCGTNSNTYDQTWDAIVGVNGRAAIIPTQYYQNNTTFYFRGFYPRTTPSGNKLNYTITGEDDLLLSNEVSGSPVNPIPPPMVYAHLLAQLSLTVQNDRGTFPTTHLVTKIEIEELPLKAQVDLSITDPAQAITATDSPEEMAQNKITLFSHAGFSVPTSPTRIGTAVMIIPNYTTKIKVTFSNNTTLMVDNLKFETFDTPQQGYSYNLTLTFKGIELAPQIDIQTKEWIAGTGINGIDWVNPNTGDNW